MVGPVRFDGLASGIDYTGIIEKLLALGYQRLWPPAGPRVDAPFPVLTLRPCVSRS